MRLGLRSRFIAIGAAAVTATILIIVTAWWVLARVAVSGPIYQDIVNAKDLIADVLPPPAYIIEENLVCLQMLGAERDELDGLEARATQLEQDYHDRLVFWQPIIPNGDMHQAMLDDARIPAETFFKLRRERFLPALRAGRVDEAHNLAFGPMRQAYEQHRAAIDRTVALATASLAASEGRAASTLHIGKLVIGAVAAISLLAIALVLWSTARGTGRAVARVAGVLEAMAAGDTGRRVEDTGVPDFDRLGRAVNRTVDNLSGVLATVTAQVGRLLEVASALGAAEGELRGCAESAGGQARTASATSESVLGSARQVAENVDQLAAGAREIARKTASAADAAGSAKGDFAEADRLLGELTAATGQIGEVTRVIGQLTGQVNLLALNATIEAARAGEAGRGFAVVAGEVKDLARRTAEANARIAERVEAVRLATGSVVAAIARVAGGIGVIAEDQQGVAAAIEEQTAATEEIRRGAAQAAEDAGRIATAVAGLAHAVEGAGAAATRNGAAAADLRRLSGELESACRQRAA